MQIIKDYFPGLVFCTFILTICYLIDNYLKSQNILLSLAFISLIFGITLNKFYLRHATLKKFTEFSLKKLLRLGIALLGISLSLNQLMMFGYMSFFLIILNIILIFLIIYIFGNYFNLSKNLSYLIGMGTAICGVTAIIATSSIINPKKNEISYAVSIVTIFGLITVLTYPYISELLFKNDDILAGIFLGASIHDTAQVSAAGMIYDETFDSENALNSAMATKLLRNSFLILLIPLLTLKFIKETKIDFKTNFIKFLPMFVVGFIVFSIFRTLGDLNFLNTQYEIMWIESISIIKFISKILILYGMLSLGLQTNLNQVFTLGYKPLIVGFIACISVGLLTIFYLKILF